MLFLLLATPGEDGTGIALDGAAVTDDAFPNTLGLSISTNDFLRWLDEGGAPEVESAIFQCCWAGSP